MPFRLLNLNFETLETLKDTGCSEKGHLGLGVVRARWQGKLATCGLDSLKERV